MPPQTYNWNRYWVPRDGAFSFDDDGFLFAPSKEPTWRRLQRTDAIEFTEIADKPCLVLLGEPGIGKTFALEQLKSAPNSLLLNLGPYGSEQRLINDLFRGNEFRNWSEHGGQLRLFLDSFDECLLRLDNLAGLLSTELRRLATTNGLSFRITSRTAEWRLSLEEAMRQVWGKENVGVYELAPLTREQVAVAVEAEGIDPKAFIDEVIEREVVAFAIKPLTLALLVRIWNKRSGSLPPTQAEIYEQGCLELCSEPNPERDTPQLRRLLTPEQRLAIAGHIAAATMFCKRSAIFTSASPTQAVETDLTISELSQSEVNMGQITLPVSAQNLRETFDTGLFTARGPDRLGWAHQTYGEFLAARYLEQQNVSTLQILALIQHPADREKRLIPQLQETAAWIASNRADVFRQIIKSEPDLLLRSDVATADDAIKQELVDALLTTVSRADFRADWWKLRSRYRKLNYSGLIKHLAQKLRDPRSTNDAKIEMVKMVEACNVRKLLPALASIAVNSRKNAHLRQVAADVVNRLGDVCLKRKLKPLALGRRGADRHDGLRGIALYACWPGIVNARELFATLKPPDDHLSHYNLFISNKLVDGIVEEDLPVALKWAEEQPKFRHFEGFGEFVQKIMQRAAAHLDKPKVLRAFIAALLSRLRLHEYATGAPSQTLNTLLGSNGDLRRKCIDIALELFVDPSADALLVTGWGVNLVQADDLPWLIARLLRERSGTEREKLAHVIRFVFYPDDAKRIEIVLNAANRCPELRNVLGLWLEPIQLDSDKGKKLKADWDQEQEWKRIAAEQQKQPPPLDPAPDQRVRTFLDRIDKGDFDAWWQICFWLGIDDQRQSPKDHSIDIHKLPGWQKATELDKKRMVAAADNYLRKHKTDAHVWFAKPDVLYRPMLAGLRALLFLANEGRERFDALPDDVWTRWLPAIAHQQHYNETEEFGFLLSIAIEKKPEAATAEILKAVERENGKGDTLWVLYKLGERLDNKAGAGLLSRLSKSPGLKTKCAAQLLTACVDAHVPGALDQTRRWLPKKPPRQNRRRALALEAAHLLLLNGTAGDWRKIWKLIKVDSAFGKTLFERFAYEHHYGVPPLLKTISPHEVGLLWEWMLKAYPVAEDPDRSRGGTVTSRWAMAEFRDGLVSSLADRGNREACQELERLNAAFPQFNWFDRVLARAKEQTRRNTWEPVSPTQLFQLASNPKNRLVQNADQLMHVVCDALEAIQAKLHAETPAAQFLWNLDRPKEEEAISDWVKIELEALLISRAIILNREVQIHIKEKTDIHVDAISQQNPNAEFGRAKVIIEVKGCWNPDQKTAMRDQLVNRYLAQNDCTHGIFLLGWFVCDEWSRNDRRRRQMKFATRCQAEEYFKAQVDRLSAGTVRLRSIVLDATIPTVRRGCAPVSKAGREKRDSRS
jgi:hypothetical protein